MKVSNLRRKLAAALVAGGLLSPAAAMAADLNVNLITNAGFENIDGTNSHILNWTDGTGQGFTYTFSDGYDNGGPLAGGGNRYFTANGTGDPRAAGIVSQAIDISTGASGALIATGNAFFSLSGFFTTFSTNNDFGFLQVDFRNAGSSTLDSVVIGPGANLQNWTQLGTSELIPVGTTTAFVSVYGGGTDGGPDGYIDNVSFLVSDEPILPALDLRVDREDGSLILSNKTGSTVSISGYEITSAFGALDPADWRSVTNNYDAGNGGPVDTQNNWTIVAGDNEELTEADLDSGSGGSLAHDQSINLGNAGAWIQNPNEDLVFQYISNGSVVTGIVSFEDAAPFADGDLNTDGEINASDWMILRSNQHMNLSGDSLAEAYRRGDLNGDLQNNFTDFATFKGLYEAANGAGSFVAMVSGSAVPEPASVVLVLSAGVLVGFAGWRSKRT